MLACAAPCAANPTAEVTLQVTAQRTTLMDTWVPDKVKGVGLIVQTNALIECITRLVA
jgi:hypothetical protein